MRIRDQIMVEIKFRVPTYKLCIFGTIFSVLVYGGVAFDVYIKEELDV